MVKETNEEQPQERYVLTKVVTQEAIAVADTKTGEVFDEKALLMEMLNKLDKIEKALA